MENGSQQLFFNHIKAKLPLHISLADEVAELLDISPDSAYRRIRGEKPLGLNELQILCNKFQVSLDQLLQLQTNTVIFSGNRVNSSTFNLDNYLHDIVTQLEMVKSLPGVHFYYYNKDIPLFHYMQFPELRTFKLFFWKRTILGYPELTRQHFRGDEEDDSVKETSRKIYELYAAVPSTEIWNEETVHVTIRQIEFYRQSNVFANKDIIIKLYGQLEELINHMELQAEEGKKFLLAGSPSARSGSFDIYINECLIGDNTIYINAGERQFTYLNHNAINFIGTQDKDFCDYTYKNLQNIMKKSALISVVGEKERSMFFNILREKIYDRKKNLG